VRPIDKPFRLSLSDFFRGGKGTGGVIVAGRIESGHVQVSQNVILMPLNEVATVKGTALVHISDLIKRNSVAIDRNGDDAKWAVAGDNVLITISNIDIENIW
jgi:translation elongation factor EF-1alpha